MHAEQGCDRAQTQNTYTLYCNLSGMALLGSASWRAVLELIACVVVVIPALNMPPPKQPECGADGECSAVDTNNFPTLQEQFDANIKRTRELRGIDPAAHVLSLTQRLKMERKERQRKKRETMQVGSGTPPPTVHPDCEPGDSTCDRRKRQQERSELERSELERRAHPAEAGGEL